MTRMHTTRVIAAALVAAGIVAGCGAEEAPKAGDRAMPSLGALEAPVVTHRSARGDERLRHGLSPREAAAVRKGIESQYRHTR